MKRVCVGGEGECAMRKRVSQAALSSRNFYDGGNALYLYFPTGKLLATCGY